MASHGRHILLDNAKKNAARRRAKLCAGLALLLVTGSDVVAQRVRVAADGQG